MRRRFAGLLGLSGLTLLLVLGSCGGLEQESLRLVRLELSSKRVTATFNQEVREPDSSSFAVHHAHRGRRHEAHGTFGSEGSRIFFEAHDALFPGEIVEVTLGTGLQSSDGSALEQPQVARLQAPVAAGSASFHPAVNYSAGDSPVSLVAGDFNHDGHLDLAAANATETGELSILLNSGDGGFEAPVSHVASSEVNTTSYAVAAGDLDGDGWLDLVVANPGASPADSGTVSVFLNQGNGEFIYHFEIMAEASPTAVTLADLNGDGALDMGVANFAANEASVLLNQGDGRFAWAMSNGTSLDQDPMAIVSGDFNKDGRIDLAMANEGSGYVSVFNNGGSGNFPEIVSWPAGDAGFSIATGDFSGNGAPNMAVATATNVVVLLNSGDGNFSETASYTVGDIPIAVAAGDLNGDGHLDLAVANAGSNDVSLLVNQGDGSFVAGPTRLAVGTYPNAIVMGDFNGDGALDLAVANRYSNNVSILLNGN